MSIVSCFYSYIIDYSHIIDYSSVTDQDIESLYLDVVYKSNMIYCDVVYFFVHFNTRLQFWTYLAYNIMESYKNSFSFPSLFQVMSLTKYLNVFSPPYIYELNLYDIIIY